MGRLVALLVLGIASLRAETPAELERLLATAAEPGIVRLEMARQCAIGGDRMQALAWFEKAATLTRSTIRSSMAASVRWALYPGSSR